MQPKMQTRATIAANNDAVSAKVLCGRHQNLHALFFGTLGICIVYWFYCHWRAIKTFNQSDIWLIPRSIFLVFFTHDLFREIDRTLVSKAKNFALPYVTDDLGDADGCCDPHQQRVDRFSSKTESITALDFVSLIFCLYWHGGLRKHKKQQIPPPMTRRPLATAS